VTGTQLPKWSSEWGQDSFHFGCSRAGRNYNRDVRLSLYGPVVDLGWTIKQNGVSESGMFRANSQCIRANREYKPIPPSAVTRISSFGDSFTHGDEVGNEDTWQEQLSRLSSGLEVLNFGVNAYGLDQAFLRYSKYGVRFNSDIVLIGFLSENILRNLNVYRPFYLPNQSAVTKPYFALEGNGLRFHKNPFQQLSDYAGLREHPEEVLPKLGVDDYFFHARYKSNVFDFLPSFRPSHKYGLVRTPYQGKNHKI
jgi:hypothetical protein